MSKIDEINTYERIIGYCTLKKNAIESNIHNIHSGPHKIESGKLLAYSDIILECEIRINQIEKGVDIYDK